jgi:hypothetical protein
MALPRPSLNFDLERLEGSGVKRRQSSMSLNKALQSDEDDNEEDLGNIIYGANYFIHDYSEDTEIASATS